jgi:hypothetical protein
MKPYPGYLHNFSIVRCSLPHTRLYLSAFPTATAVTALGDDVKNHLSRLLTPVLGPNNLNSLVLGLIAGDLDLSASLLAEVVDGSTTGADDEPVMCVSLIERCRKSRVLKLPVASRIGQDKVTGGRGLGRSLDSLLKPLTGLG